MARVGHRSKRGVRRGGAARATSTRSRLNAVRAACYSSTMRMAAMAFPIVLGLMGCGATATSTRAAGSSGEDTPPAEQCTATLRIEPLDERTEPGEDVAIPFARITAVRHCERSGSSRLVTGDERGICTAASAGSAVARVSCWWAGRTSETVLVQVDRTLVVRRLETVDERVRGEPEELGALGLPENSVLVPLARAGDR